MLKNVLIIDVCLLMVFKETVIEASMQLISANIRGISGSPHPSLVVELMEPEIVTRLHKNSHLLRVVLFRGKRRCNPEKNGLGRCCWYSIEHCHSWISNDFNGSLSDL